MPYSNVPESEWGKMDSCVEQVMREQGVSKERAIAICHSSIVKESAPSFAVFKQANGRYRWIARSANAYRDNDGEIVSMRSLEDDAARMEATGDYGPLRWWHMPGVDIGDCDFSAMHGRTRIESGTFKSQDVAEGVARVARNLAVSIGFTHPASEPDADGVYHNIRVFERSLLPRAKAANPFTSISVDKEIDMATLKEKWNEFVLGVFGGDEEKAKRFASATEDTQKALEEAGVKFKAKKVKADMPKEESDDGSEDGMMEDEAGEEKADAMPEEMDDEVEAEVKRGGTSGPAERAIGSLTADELVAMVKEAAGSVLAEQQAVATKERIAIGDALQAIEERLKALEGDQPATVRAHVASADPGTINAQETLKQALGQMPKSTIDGLVQFMMPNGAK